MAACCAVGALIIYHILSIHSRLPSLRLKSSSEKTGQSKAIEDDLVPAVSHGRSQNLSRCRRTIRFSLSGLTCQSCVSAVEDSLLACPGVKSVVASLQTRSACITYDDEATEAHDLAGAIEGAGYTVEKQTASENWRDLWVDAAVSRDKELARLKGQFNVAFAAGVLVLAIEYTPSWSSSIRQYIPHYLALVVSILSVTFVAMPLHREALNSVRHGRPTSSLLASVGVLLVMSTAVHDYLVVPADAHHPTFALSAPCLLLAVLLGGKVTKSLVSEHSTQLPEVLAASLPSTARLLPPSNDTSQVQIVPPDLLCGGDSVLVASGAFVPADCTVLSGEATLLQTIVNGETLPTSIGPRDKILTGCLVLEGALIARVDTPGTKSWLGLTLAALSRASGTRPGSETYVDRLLAIFCNLVLVLAIATAVFHSVLGSPLEIVLTRVASVLLCACPCSLGLAVPICVMSATATAHEKRVVLRPASQSISLASSARTIVFDKTGTLTHGHLSLQGVQFAEEWDSRRQLFWDLVCSLTAESSHPVSRLLYREATSAELDDTVPRPGFRLRDGIENHAGLGCCGVVLGHQDEFEIAIGNVEFMHMKNLYPEFDASERDVGIVYIAIGGRLAATACYSDEIVSDALDTISALKDLEFEVHMMTGDTTKAAHAAGRAVGIRNIHASLLPQQKATLIEQLRRRNGPVIMVGDNLNDIAALASADFGIAVSHSGATVSKDNTELVSLLQREADAYLLPPQDAWGADLSRVVDMIRLSQAAQQRVMTVVKYSLVYNLVAVTLASGVTSFLFPTALQRWIEVGPTFASAAMSISSIATLLYALRGYS